MAGPAGSATRLIMPSGCCPTDRGGIEWPAALVSTTALATAEGLRFGPVLLPRSIGSGFLAESVGPAAGSGFMSPLLALAMPFRSRGGDALEPMAEGAGAVLVALGCSGAHSCFNGRT